MMLRPEWATPIRRGIALVEIAGGAWGLLRSTGRLWHQGMNMVTLSVVILLTILFLLLLIAGILLWMDRPGGRAMSFVVQAVQVPHIVTSPFGFLFGSPASLSAGIQMDGTPRISALWHPSIAFALDSEVEFSWIGVNLIAILLLVLLFWLDRQRAAGVHRA